MNEQYIWYLYGIDGDHDEIALVSGIIQTFGLDNNMVKMVHISLWDKFLSMNPSGILIHPMPSNILKRHVIDIRDKDVDLFIISLFSTEVDPLLEGDHILRLLYEDGLNIPVFKEIIARQDNRHIILIQDREHKWSVDLITGISVGNNYSVYDINDVDSIQANVDAYVIALIDDALHRLMGTLDISNINGLLLGDISLGLTPGTQDELDYLNSMNAQVLLPDRFFPPKDLYNTISKVTGEKNVTALLGVIISGIQIAYYLIRSVNRDKWGKQKYLVGSDVDKIDIDGILPNYLGIKFTQVGKSAIDIDKLYYFVDGTIDTIPVSMNI